MAVTERRSLSIKEELLVSRESYNLETRVKTEEKQGRKGKERLGKEVCGGH